MGLVADDQVEVAHGEQLPLLVLHRVDAVHHGLVGGKDAPGRTVGLLLTEIRNGQIGKKIGESPFCLHNEARPVSQKQDIFDPAVAEQDIHQGNDHTGFAAARRHDEQRLAPVAAIKCLTDGLDSFLLVVSVGNAFAYEDVLQTGTGIQLIEFLEQIALGVHAGYHPFRVVSVVPHMRIKTIGEKNDWTPTEFLFKKIGV